MFTIIAEIDNRLNVWWVEFRKVRRKKKFSKERFIFYKQKPSMHEEGEKLEPQLHILSIKSMIDINIQIRTRISFLSQHTEDKFVVL